MVTERQNPASREAFQRRQRIVRNLLSTQPFFANLALTMPFVEDNTRKTIASDGETIRYNAEWMRQAHGDEIKYAVARLVWACALKHHTRRGDRDYAKWQQASQMVTLPLLREAGLTNERGGVESSIEQAYLTLPDNPDSDKDQDGDGDDSAGGGAGGGQNGPPSQDPNGQGEIMDSPSSKKPDEGQSDGKASGQPQQGDGQQGDGQQGDGDDGGQGQQRTDQETRIRDEEQKWDRAMHQAHQMAKRQGNMPGNVSEEIEGFHRHPADWRTMLRRYMTEQAKMDYSWSHPNRRFIDDGLYLPSQRSEGTCDIVFAVDTSASLDNRALAAIWSEIRGICQEIEPGTITLIECDTHVRHVSEYPGGDLPEKVEMHGRGGTAFVPVFEYVEDESLDPKFLIYLTDLECYGYGEEPPYPVFWACANDGGFTERVRPPYGDVIDMELNNALAWR